MSWGWRLEEAGETTLGDNSSIAMGLATSAMVEGFFSFSLCPAANAV
jgi:hypothetical protein